jgi:hypothetical protein
MKRFTQPAYSIYYFSDEIFVKCPKCNGFAKVNITRESDYCYKKSLNCFECGFMTTKGWFGYWEGFIKFHCGFCGSKIEYSTKKPTKKLSKDMVFCCPRCKVTKRYPLKWYRCNFAGRDLYFGLELWLKISVKNQTLWAYNLEHLSYIKDYISSDLREDNNRYKYSIITNMPKWMKVAKNRDLLIKKINSLEKSLPKV